MQTAGNLVSAAAEFAAGMQLCKDKVHRISSGLVIDPHRDPAAVIHDRDRVAGMDDHGDFRAESCQRFVDRIVHDLIDKVMETP